MELQPTLWRTCRILASPPRLQLMRVLLEYGTASVSILSDRAHFPSAKGSLHLRALNARGLITASTKGRFVFYEPTANPSVFGADEILNALKLAISSGMTDEEIIHYTTAFTHQRRITIVKALNTFSGNPAALSIRTGISQPALFRHVEKLRTRDMVRADPPPLKLEIPENLFGHALLKAALKH